MKKMKSLALIVLLMAGCHLGENQSTNLQSTTPSPKPLTMKLEAEDWHVTSHSKMGLTVTERSLKPEKLEFIRRNFVSPEVNSISIPESHGFQIMEVKGYPEFESFVYVHPKVYVNTGSSQGSILGYRLGTQDPSGQDLIEISVPVALVDGMVPLIPLPGGPNSGPGAAISLPDKFQIPSVEELSKKLGKGIKTLPVCPTMFRLVFENKEYWSSNQGFECVPNQFFRVRFHAPVHEMKRILESASIRDESVNLIAELSVEMNVPKKMIEVEIDPKDFERALKSLLVGKGIKDESGNSFYAGADLEDSILETFFKLGKQAELNVWDGAGVQSRIRPLIAAYFSEPFSCNLGANCRTWLKTPRQHAQVSFSWNEEEPISSPIVSETVSSLGAVANSTLFLARPSFDQLKMLRRPSLLKARDFLDILKECKGYHKENYTFIPELTEEEKEDLKSYCETLVDNLSTETDDYYPLGSNTVVYPGAWLKIDVDDISEFTTARTRALSDGRQVIESQVIDLLSSDLSSKSVNLTSCIEGSEVACTEYETKRKEFRDAQGNTTLGPCEKGSVECVCRNEDGREICQRPWFPVLAYDCPSDALSFFCPYWRTEEEVIGYEIKPRCEVEEKSSTVLLGLLGSKKTTELVCHDSEKTPVVKPRQKLNCLGEDPKGIAPKEERCQKPEYRCKTWQRHCTRYNVNEVFQVNHEEIIPKWRPFAIEQGEYPKRFEEDIDLKFVSPGRVAKNCSLSQFPRELRGNSIFIKIPTEENEVNPCDIPIWEKGVNTNPLFFPKVYVRNSISYSEQRLCGKTEYSYLTRDLPASNNRSLVPREFSAKTEVHIGPVENSCRADHPFRVGADLWFTEYPPIRFSGRVSVLGRVLESLISQEGS